MFRQIDLVPIPSPQIIPQQVPPCPSGRLGDMFPALLDSMHRQVVNGRKLLNGVRLVLRERFEISLQKCREQHRVRQGVLFRNCLVNKVPTMLSQNCLDPRLSRLDNLPILAKQDGEGLGQLKVGRDAQAASRAGEP